MIPEDLEKKVIAAQKSGKQPFYVTATSGTTVKGAFDPIKKIAEICSRHKIWLHVDVRVIKSFLKSFEWNESLFSKNLLK